MFIEKLKHALQTELPGPKAQYKMAPVIRNFFPANKSMNVDNPGNSAVLILLFPVKKTVHTVFIRRARTNGPHSGQISFPGGKFEPQDKNLEDTALRETREELGCDTQNIKVIGKLSKLHIPVSNLNVYPFVAYSNDRPKYKPNASEVQYVIEAALENFLNRKNLTRKMITSKGFSLKAPFYNLNNQFQLWGATAMILAEFIEIINNMKK